MWDKSQVHLNVQHKVLQTEKQAMPLMSLRMTSHSY